MQQEFERRFAEQRDIIYAEGTSFSGSAVFAELQEIEKLARGIGENSRERTDVLALMSELQRRRHEWEDAIQFAQQSLAIQRVTGNVADPQLFDLHYAIADSSEAIGDFKTAVAEYRHALSLMVAKPGLSAAQRLGIRQSFGRSLHEAGAHEEALSVNQAVLADAEKFFGAEDARLTGVLNNLAQNEHELGNAPAAQSYLQRRLRLARETKKLAVELDTLFQLGVLACEQGSPEEARRLMGERLALARSRGDAFDVKNAEAKMAELERRIATACKDKKS